MMQVVQRLLRSAQALPELNLFLQATACKHIFDGGKAIRRTGIFGCEDSTTQTTA
jgi:hypothetical protein